MNYNKKRIGLGCASTNSCPVYDMWADINSRVHDVLNDDTLADVVAAIKAKAKKPIKAPRCR